VAVASATRRIKAGEAVPVSSIWSSPLSISAVSLSRSALMFQRPEKQGEVAVVVPGGKGVGKGIFFNYLRKAWGQHGIYISSAKHLVGNFNAHLRDCVMLFADEAFFANDRQHESVLKGAVTDPVLAIEGKHQNVVNAPNMLHIGMASNADWVIPASHDERRYFMLDASDHRCGQKAYFAAIVAQMDAGGLAAMIHEMLHRDISSFDVRDVPQTDALAEQKKHSLDSLDRWWLAVLERGFVWRSRFGATAFDNWDDVVSTELLNRSYLQWCSDNRVNYPMSRVQLGKRMTELYPAHRDKAGIWRVIGEVESLARFADPVIKKDRPPGYKVQSLDEARAQFLEMRKISKDWGDGGDGGDGA
jgi:phage/plasmid-associated DNA primase